VGLFWHLSWAAALVFLGVSIAAIFVAANYYRVLWRVNLDHFLEIIHKEDEQASTNQEDKQ
jgi:hypothetical protein